jgi:molybdenum cofactor cytidylyltransferase
MSRRLGQNKLLLPWGETTVLGRVLSNTLAASRLESIILVLGHQAEEICCRLKLKESPRLSIAVNKDYEKGQSTSLRTGLALVPNDQSAIFILGDQPLITAEIIDDLILAWRESSAAIVAPVDEPGRRGNPVLFSPTLFPELESLRGDQGGKQVMEKYGNKSFFLPVPNGIFDDIDSVDDYEKMLCQLKESE